ncbi:MAG: hypothetical protein KF893_11440 [Caldilineaceae bacterium]|nr:hypothetical protein [Caldilineaceae bacterium]
MTILAQSPAQPISPQQVQANFISYFRHFVDLPGITLVENEEITWAISNGAPGNNILRTCFTSATVDRQIDETLRRIGEDTNTMDWLIFPDCQPSNLGERLLAYAESNGEWMLHGNIGVQPGTWMVINLDALPPYTPPAGFYVRQVTDQAMLSEWTDINARGFGSDDYSAFHAAYSRHGFGPHAEVTHFIGYMNGEPVTSSTLLADGMTASAYNISTPTTLRRQGLGSAITHSTLQHARDFGYHHSWIWASNLGRSVYAKLGFGLIDFGIREYQWKKRGD